MKPVSYLALGLIVTLLVSDCTRAPETSKEQAVSDTYNVHLGLGLGEELKVSAEGEEFGPFVGALRFETTKGKEIVSIVPSVFEVHKPPGGWTGSDGLPDFRGQINTPCGWKDVSFSVSRAQSNRSYLYLQRLWPGPFMNVRFDNRGGKATEVLVGELHVGIPENKAWDFTLIVKDCSAAVTLDGKKVGHFSSADWKDDPNHGYYLLDTVGHRCYRSRYVYYSSTGTVYLPPGMQPKVGAGLLSGSQFMRLPSWADYFLTPAPTQLKIEISTSPWLKKHEVIEVPCSQSSQEPSTLSNN